jgi:DNA-binding NarL/FixJ family response regulator
MFNTLPSWLARRVNRRQVHTSASMTRLADTGESRLPKVDQLVADQQSEMSKEAKYRSLTYRVRTPEERAQLKADVDKRAQRIMVLKAQGLNNTVIAARMGLSPSHVGKIAREHCEIKRTRD